MSDFRIPNQREIAACSDAALLGDWHREAYDISDSIVAKIESARMAETATRDWLQRASTKAAIAKIAMKRIERRFLELGLTPPITRDGHERRIIRELRAEIRSLRERLKSLSMPEPSLLAPSTPTVGESSLLAPSTPTGGEL